MRRITMSVVLTIFMSTTSYAQYSVWCMNCSESVTQGLDRVTNIEELQQLYTQVTEALKQTEQQIQIAQTTFSQYQNMLKNTASLPGSIKSQLQGQFNNLTSLTRDLNVMRGDASGLSQVYRAVYSGRTTLEGVARTADAPAQYREMFKKMSEDLDRSQEAAFQESGKQLADLEQKAAELDTQLDDLLQTPEGQMQAIQAGNQLAGMQLQEMQKLRSLLAVSAQSNVQKQSEDSKRQQVKDEENAKEQEAFQKVKSEPMNKTQF